ncbi:Beta-lactamase-like protein 2 [Fusarium austroafricanum]|uniref:Beta-lactamase-like protein 2 n=1 Tax=Fusarium austroafricanum TaxID=2364996 RepID=A0A8H4P0K6_9HYPO|nr:Beta-lactamase-like protein 2 [Fusarium austroafricanum]
MLFSESLPTLFTLAAGLHQVVEAAPHYCPPNGPVLPAPRQPSQHPAVKFALDAITSTIKEQVGSFNVSGVSIGIQSIYEDKPMLDFHHTPPKVNPKLGAKKVDINTVYRLGSISKVFTVLAALQLQEDGVLNMDDPVTKWIPELANNYGSSHRDELNTFQWNDITVGDAAAHLAGLGSDMTNDITALPFDWQKLGLPKVPARNKAPSCKGAAEGSPICTKQGEFAIHLSPVIMANKKDFINVFKNYRPPVYNPGQSPLYSNAGISLVGLVVEAASNKTFDAAINDMILKPLGLRRTYTGIVSESNKNMFIPAGSADWNQDIGVLGPSGEFGASTSDLLKFMTGILDNKAMSASATRRWLKPNTFISTWAASVGSPWEIYRVDNLTSDGRIIDIYTKAGEISSYHSFMTMLPEFGLTISFLSAGPEVSPYLSYLTSLNIVEGLIPVMDMAARDEAKARFAGKYIDKKTGSEVILSLDQGPGLVLSNWTARKFDVLPNINRFQPGNYNSTADSGLKSLRMYPTGIENKARAAWRAVIPSITDEQAEMLQNLTKVQGVTCITWHTQDRPSYNEFAIDHFEFKYGEDGSAVSIKSKMFDVEMTRVTEKVKTGGKA